MANMIKKSLLGWQEWCELPLLNIPYIKAKIDTGAKTSALHAFNITPFMKRKQKWVEFEIHPLQGSHKVIQKCQAKVIDEREVMSSTGHTEHRYVIMTELTLGLLAYSIELTLSNRDLMKFRMLLGREALQDKFLVDPAHKMLLGRHSKKEILRAYTR
ncbi:MAG: ribosomal protein modification protein RimK [Gammaproteobacteria bacterium]|jgi:ribosomal protein S6--L-glutamate ligase|nr:ribosomal protein modification protein RimK [Gammaproteobacteria bacterium]